MGGHSIKGFGSLTTGVNFEELKKLRQKELHSTAHTNGAQGATGMSMNESILNQSLQSEPVAVASSYDDKYVTGIYGGDNKYDALNQIEETSNKESVSDVDDGKTQKARSVDGIPMSSTTTVTVDTLEDGTEVSTISFDAIEGLPKASNTVSMSNLVNLSDGRRQLDSVLNKMEADLEKATSDFENMKQESLDAENDITQLKADLGAKNAEVKDAQYATKNAKADYSKAQQETESCQSKFDAKKQDYADTKSNTKEAETNVNEAESGVESSKSEVASAQASVADLESQLAAAPDDKKAEIQAKLDQAKDNLAKAEEKLDKAEVSLDKAKEKLDKAKEKEANAKTEMDDAEKKLDSAKEKEAQAKQKFLECKEKSDTLEAEQRNMESGLDSSRHSLQDLKQDTESLGQEIQAFRELYEQVLDYEVDYVNVTASVYHQLEAQGENVVLMVGVLEAPRKNSGE